MSPTLEAILALAEGDVPKPLISRNALLTLKSVCRLLPIHFSSGFGFESRVAEDSAEVDLIVRVPAVPGLEILAGVDRSCTFPNHFFSEPSWEKLRNLALHWQRWPKKLHETVLYVWLEFDADELGKPMPSPGLLFLQMGKRQHSYEDCYRVTQRAYEIINNRPIRPDVAQAFHTCVERLPRHGSIVHVGMGMARPTEAIRLVLGDLSPGDILNYLGSTGWPGHLRTIVSFFQDLHLYTVRFNLALDVLSSVCARVGFECFMDRQEHPAKDADWRRFIEFVTERGWCSPEKSAGLLAWPGRNLFRDGKDPWPWVVERLLSHIKISCDAVCGIEAKAYFGLVWRPLATGSQR